MTAQDLVVPLLVFGASVVLTGLLRRYALARRMLDLPNARSSHSVPTPRGGGAAIALSTSAALTWLWWSQAADALPLAVVVSGVAVALVGFVDDHVSFPAIARLGVHFVAAAFAATALDVQRTGPLLGIPLTEGLAGTAIAVVFIVWVINLTNFMDGIDGIAGAEILMVCVVGSILHAVTHAGNDWPSPAVILGSATAGFLLWNWPPARIFMGDVGSGYVGFLLAVLILRTASNSAAHGWSWIILFAVFVTDATVTLVRRAGRGQPLFQAHRSHAYQHLAVAWRSHLKVVWLVIATNLMWLTPIALLVATRQIGPVAGLTLAYLPLSIGVMRLGGGVAKA